MIVAEQKPLEDIQRMLKGKKKVLTVGCGTCVSVCFAGGKKESRAMAATLRTAAAAEGVIFPLGSVFFVDKSSENSHFRLAYTRESKEHLEDAGKRIRSAFEKILD